MVTDIIIQPPRTMMEVFESLPEGTHVQLIENNLIMSPAPIVRHQLILDIIYPSLSTFVRKKKLGITLTATTDVFLDKKNAFQPDIMFISNERSSIVKEKAIYGAPDLVIEMLSPSTAKYDLTAKKKVYERNGVTEYWVVDPAANKATGYYLVNDEYHEFFSGKGRIQSKLLNWKVSF